MSRVWLSAMFVAVLVLYSTWTVVTQAPRKPGPLRIEKVKDDLFMVSGEGGNVAIEVTNEGVILVDDMFYRNHADILAQVKSLTDKPVRYVFNTHQHDDHAGGNAKMLPIAEIIAHRNVRTNLVAKRQPYYEDTPGTPIGLPRLTFADEASVFLGGKEVRAMHFGRGHTNGDAVVYFPDARVVHMGDLFLGRRPGTAGAPMPSRALAGSVFIDYAQGGSLLEWTRTIEAMLTLDFDTVIPGHGPVSTRDDVVKLRTELGAMQQHLAGLVKQNKSKEEILQVLEAEYGWKVIGCPASPPTAGCLQVQQVDALIAELSK